MHPGTAHWRPAVIGGMLLALGFPAAGLAAPAISLRATQAHDSSDESIVSIWMTTNEGSPAGGEVQPPLVFTKPGIVACPSSPTFTAAADTQELYGSARPGPGPAHYQPVVRIPTTRAEKLTVCGYLLTAPEPEGPPVTVAASARTTIAVAPPKGRSRIAVDTGPWRSCAEDRPDQLLRILANRHLTGGCTAATRLANGWVNTLFRTTSSFVLPAYDEAFVPPLVHWTSFPDYTLHRTLMCSATSAKGLPYFTSYTDIIVNCGLAAFRFTPGR